MEWKIGVIPRPPWRAQEAPRQALRTAHNEHMLREDNAAANAAAQVAPALKEQASAATAPKAKLPPPDSFGGGYVPPEQAKLHRSLIQKLNDILSDPRRCPRGACRRHQRCTAGARECMGIKNRKPVSKEAGEAVLADIARA